MYPGTIAVMKIVHPRTCVCMSNMDMFQSPQLNKQVMIALNLMYLATPVAYKTDSGPKLTVLTHMMNILM